MKDHNHATERNCNLFDGNVDWPDVRKALQEIGYAGWATAEVKGGTKNASPKWPRGWTGRWGYNSANSAHFF